MKKRNVCFLLLVALCGKASAQLQALEPFKQGDRITFVGNSITEAGYYESYIWLYYMLHFPGERIRIYNVGIGGDRAKNILDRFEDDVLPKRPSVICLTFGMNDTGYYEFLGANPDSGAQARVKESYHYFELIQKKLKALPDVKKVLIASSPYDETVKNPKNYFPKKTLAMLEIAKFQEQAARDNHWGYVDFLNPMNEIDAREQKKDSTFTLTGPDRIHPGNAGHFVMAWLFLKAQGLGNKPVADIAIDAATGKVDRATNCQITNVSGTAKSGAAASSAALRFDYLAASLPFPVDTLPRLWGNPSPQSGAVGVMPFYTEFNREMLRVKGLKDKTYTLTMDGKPIGRWTGAQLREGINLAAQTNTPEYEQAMAVLSLNEERMGLESKLRAYYWLQFDYLRDLGLKFNDNQAALDSVMSAAAKRWDVASKRDNYRAARYASVREAWQKEMDVIIDEIYTVNKPKTHKVELKEAL
jgi:lysophospholipase L1-like esterase